MSDKTVICFYLRHPYYSRLNKGMTNLVHAEIWVYCRTFVLYIFIIIKNRGLYNVLYTVFCIAKVMQ